MTEMIRAAVRGVKIVEAAEGGDAGDGPARTVAGVAVQYGVTGRVSNGWLVRFEAGSLGDPDSVKLYRDHEYPIGIVASWEDDEDSRSIVGKISRFPRGDEALALAADGVLDSFSVGVQPLEYTFEASDEHHGEEVLVVHKGLWAETSLLPFGAFPGAKVTKVAASAVLTHPSNIKEAPVADTPVVEAAEAPPVTVVPMTDPALPQIAASLEKLTELANRTYEQPATVPAGMPTPDADPFLNAGEYTFYFLRAKNGDKAAIQRIQAAMPKLDIEAALTTVGTTTHSGIVPPAYTTEILGNLPVWTPALDGMVRHAALPEKGMSIIKPRWTDLPEGDWYPTENAEPATDATAIGTETVSVLAWAHAIRASIALIERSSFGGYAQAYFDAVGMSYLSDKEKLVVDTIFSEATASVSFTPNTTTPLVSIGELLEDLVDNQSDVNGNFRGFRPDYVGVSANEFAQLMRTEGVFQWAQGSLLIPSLEGALSGLQIVLLPTRPPGDYVMGARAATLVYDQANETELRAEIPSTMSIELGVMFFTAVDVEYPDAIVKATFGS